MDPITANYFYYYVIVSVVEDEMTLKRTNLMRRVLKKQCGVLKADGVNYT